MSGGRRKPVRRSVVEHPAVGRRPENIAQLIVILDHVTQFEGGRAPQADGCLTFRQIEKFTYLAEPGGRVGFYIVFIGQL